MLKTLLSTAAIIAAGATCLAGRQTTTIQAPATPDANMVVNHVNALPDTEATATTQFQAMTMTDIDGHQLSRYGTAKTDESPAFQFGVELNQGWAAVTKCVSTEAEVTIPDEMEYNGKKYPVKLVYTQCFSGLQTLKTVNFGKNVTTIMTQAFLACMNLSTVNLNEGLLEIGANAFGTFMRSIKEITLPSTVKVLGEKAFIGCTLTGEFIINRDLETIGGGAFAGQKITGFYICEEGNNHFISKEGVLYTKDGESLVMFPPAIVTAEMTLPDGLKKIAPYAFSNCTVITKFNMPESLEEIGDFAFRGTNISEFTVTKNVKKIGSGAFQSITKLTKFTVADGNTNFTTDGTLLIDNNTKTLLGATYFTGDLNVPAGIERIAPYLCYSNPGVSSLVCPASVKYIDDYAFYEATGLTKVEFPGAVRIGRCSFLGITKVDSIAFPASLKFLGNSAFANTTKLVSAILPEGLDTLERAAFYGSSDLIRAHVPGTCKFMGDAIFYQCTNLNEVTMGEGASEIPTTMFYGDTKLYFFTFPKSIKYVRNAAFSFSWLQEANLPDGIIEVEDNGFQLCPLHSIDLPNSLERIGSSGFSLTNATYIKCGSGLKYIGPNGFQSASKATSIELNEGLETIGFRALYGERGVKTLTIPSTVTTLGDSCMIMSDITKLINKAATPQTTTAPVTGLTWKTEWNPTPHYIYDTCTLSVPKGSVEAYRSAAWWNLYTNIEGFEAGIDDIDADEARIVEIYSTDGQRRDTLEKGINICRYSNGRVVKILSKE